MIYQFIFISLGDINNMPEGRDDIDVNTSKIWDVLPVLRDGILERHMVKMIF